MRVGPSDAELFDQELKRLMGSDMLRKSDSLRRLLAYLAEAHTAGKGRDLKEYAIGRDVMGKPEDYDPRIDASVRVQISKLRQRLEQYYATEGQEAEHQIHLPKGHFELALVPRPEVASSRARGDRRWRLTAAGLAVLCMLLAVALLARWQGTPSAQARVFFSQEMALFWNPLLDSSRPLTVVLGSPLFVRFHSSYYRDPWANTWEEVQRKVPLSDIQRALNAPTPGTETHRWAPFGEAVAAFRLAQSLSPLRSDIQIKRSSVLSWEDVRASNLIFVGPRKFNPQLRDLPVRQDFIVESGEIRNVHPATGELAVYRRNADPEIDDIPEDFALITRLSGLQGWGEVLVLASTTTEGTWAAAEFVTNEEHMAELMRMLAPDGTALPDCFQVLIKCRFKQQVPIQSEYVLHHVLDSKAPLDEPAQR